MVTGLRITFAVLLTAIAVICQPAAAGRIGDGEPDRILIADPSPALVRSLSGKGFRTESTERLEALNLSLTIVLPPRQVSAARAIRDLESAFPDALMALDDPFRPADDGQSRRSEGPAHDVLSAIDWPPDDSAAGAGMRVGIIDSALDSAHPALRNASIVERSFTSGKAPATDTAHGTAIASMLVGDSNDRSVSGLLRGAHLHYASIFQISGRGAKASSADFLRAIDWMLKSGVTVINASITSPNRNPVVLYAMSMLEHKQAIVVAAAGNGGPSAPPVYPAAIDSAFAVTAVSTEGYAYPYANVGAYIDISAPGIDLPTTSRKVTSGTSLAVPFVTAAVARMVHLCGLSPKAAQSNLQAHARDLGARGWDSHFGWGLLQAPRCDAHAGRALDAGAGPRPPAH